MDHTEARAESRTLPGEVVFPGDDAYEQLSRSATRTGRPALIVRCHVPRDVRAAVRFARDHDLALSVRCGGHSGAGLSTNDDGLVIDLSPMSDIEVVDESGHIVRIGGGATWGAVADALAPHQLAISSGDTTSVGVGGLILGGGIGWKVRKHGLALDNLVAADVVTADGEIVRATADDNPDLFWALRGGGGNFGVVTAFEVAAHPTTDVYFGTITYAFDEAPAIITGWSTQVRSAPEELTTSLQILPAFDGSSPTLQISVCFDSDDADAAARAVEPLLALGTVLESNLETRAYAGVLETPHGPGELPPDFDVMAKNRFAGPVDADMAAALVTGTTGLAPLVVELRSLGGAMGRVPAEATAFAHRSAETLIVIARPSTRSDNVATLPLFEALWQELAPGTEGAYVNFLTTATEDDVAAIYPPATHARLAEVKKAYDPGNLFASTHNIRPA